MATHAVPVYVYGGVGIMIDCSQGQISDDRWAFLCDSFAESEGGKTALDARATERLLDYYQVKATSRDLARQIAASVADFAERFGDLCKQVIVPVLQRAVANHARSGVPGLPVQIQTAAGRTAPTSDGTFDGNQRVGLRTIPNLTAIFFVAWAPNVLVVVQAGGAKITRCRLGDIDVAFVERTVNEFLNGISLPRT